MARTAESLSELAVTPILLLEINEIPWRLIDRFVGDPGFPRLNEFFKNASHYTTLAVDVGELSPWVTWPTLHRGMNNERHGVRNLGQDPSTFRGQPIWQAIRDKGGTIGICGSMQSWPPIDPGAGGFYIPDTFAHDDQCRPEYLRPLQAFNLSQVRESARVVNGKMPGVAGVVRAATASLRSGITVRTGARIAGQLLRERFNRSLVVRRPIFQTILFWDVFRKHFDAARPPALSTFFTNHVAGVMHRYWKDVFPEDFPGEDAPAESHEWVMRFALEVLDDMLGDVIDWAERNPDLVVVFASSMGQGAVHRGYHEGVELIVEDLASLMRQAGLARADYKSLLAMAPQVAVEIEDAALRERCRATLESAVCGRGHHFIKVQAIGTSLSVTVSTPPLADMADATFEIDGRRVAWEDAGIRKQAIEPGTGYHIPQGTLAVLSRRLAGTPPHQDRLTVPADRIKDWLLSVSAEGHAKIPALASLSS